ncbi:MAG: EAL domain-containing protein [Mobilitalea sp.]
MKSIKTKGIVFAITIILISISGWGYGAYLHARNIIIKEINQAVITVAEESADHLNNYINQFISPLIALAEDKQMISMDWPKQREIIDAQIIPYYLGIAVIDKEGIAHYPDETVLDLSDRDYIQSALKGKISFSEVVESRKTGENVIMVAVPIYDEEHIKGALIARLDVDFLAEFAVARGYGENGHAYIISKKGTFISRPKAESSREEYNIYDLGNKDNNYLDFANFVKSTDKKQSGYGEYNFENNVVLMGYASVPETSWKIYIGTYENDVLEGLNNFGQQFAIGLLLTICFASIAAWLFVNRISKPIIELDHLFEKGATGDLTIRFTPKTKDEIGRVGISFNKMMDKIKTLTQYDPLTALQNQYVLEYKMNNLVNSTEEQEFSLIMVAIDKFSVINETYGYSAGDMVLREVAARISNCISDNYEVYRYKGDEFVVLGNEQTSEVDINSKAQRILLKLNESYQIDRKLVDLSINIGVLISKDAVKSEEPLKAVTNAMNYAKFMGSNQIQFFDQQIHDNLIDMRAIQSDIIEGIRENQFYLVYQPLFYLNNDKVAEVEALIRWNHPQRGLLYPDKFIDLAEQTGYIISLDFWVMETVCKQLQSWKKSNRELMIISLNISAKTFETNKFIPQLLHMVHQYDIDTKLLQIEITERVLIKNVEESILKLNHLREMGIRIAIDDFGIGYSSLSYIVRLPIDSIKIDKSFTFDINTSIEAQAIVSAIIHLGKALNLSVIAEGIEGRTELEYLKKNECDIGQGYYFSRPVSLEVVEKIIFRDDIKIN